MSFKDCVVESQRCLEDITTLDIQHNTQTDFLHIIKDKEGQPVDLTVFTEEPTEPGTGTCIQIVVKDRFDKNTPDFQAAVEIEDATNGTVILKFEPLDIKRPGLYLMVLNGIINDKIRVFWPHYLMVDPGLNYANCGPITPAEIRIALRDSCPEANTLLDEVEFTDQEIHFAIRRPVDYWNSALPPLNPVSPSNFPYRYQWLDATIGELMVIAGRQYLRNKLDYSAGSVSIDDKNKDGPYLQIGKQMIDEWKEFVTRTKVGQNMMLAMGGIGSSIGNNFYRGSRL